METKVCTKCGEEKPLDEFSRFKTPRGAPPWFKSVCKKCCNANKKRNRDRTDSRRRYAKDREILPDALVAKHLHMRVADCTPELIELKREQILTRRITKQLTTLIKEQNHGTE